MVVRTSCVDLKSRTTVAAYHPQWKRLSLGMGFPCEPGHFYF